MPSSSKVGLNVQALSSECQARVRSSPRRPLVTSAAKNRSESGCPSKGKGLRVFWTYRHLGVHRRRASSPFECLLEVHPLVVQLGFRLIRSPPLSVIVG